MMLCIHFQAQKEQTCPSTVPELGRCPDPDLSKSGQKDKQQSLARKYNNNGKTFSVCLQMKAYRELIEKCTVGSDHVSLTYCMKKWLAGRIRKMTLDVSKQDKKVRVS